MSGNQIFIILQCRSVEVQRQTEARRYMMAYTTEQIRTRTPGVLVLFYFIQSNMEKEKILVFYYEYVHWSIQHSIYQIRKGSYPLEYWKQDLQNNLELRQKTITRLAHLVWQPGSQLELVF